MGGSYTIRRFKAEDRDKIFELIEVVWGKQAAANSREIWFWKIENNPFKKDNFPGALVVEHNNNIVGMLTAMPLSIKIQDKNLTGFQLGDFATHPEHRGHGHRLLKKMMSEAKLLLAETNENSYPLLKKLGWSDVYTIMNLICITNMGSILMRKTENKLIHTVGRIAWNVIHKGIAIYHYRKGGEVSVEKVARFDQSIDHFWEDVSRNYRVIVNRNMKFLNWRFVDKPGKKYTIFMAKRADRIQGYIVTKVEPTDGLMFGHIIDVMVEHDDNGALCCLVSEAVKELEARGVDLVTCYISPLNRFYEQTLKKCGFYFKTSKYPILYYNNSKEINNNDLTESSDWFITRGNSDMDM